MNQVGVLFNAKFHIKLQLYLSKNTFFHFDITKHFYVLKIEIDKQKVCVIQIDFK